MQGFGLGGTLGPVSVYGHKKRNTVVAVTPDPEVWDLLFKGHVAGTSPPLDVFFPSLAKRFPWTAPPSQAELAYVKLPQPVLIEAGTTLGFYVHVAVFHDDGLLYQTYQPNVRPAILVFV